MGSVFRSTFVTYSTVKVVEVNDRRLRFIHVALSLSIVIYTVIVLTVLHQGARFESISAAVNAWEGGMVPPDVLNPVPNYCSNSSYSWEAECYESDLNASLYNSANCAIVRQVSNSWYIRDPTCIQFDGHSHTVLRDSSAAARTHISRFYYNCTEWRNSTLSGARVCLNRTYLPTREAYLLHGMDDFFFMMQHSVSASFLQDLLVPTTVWDHLGNQVAYFPRNALVGYLVPMRDWMAWGGGSFEEPVGPLAVNGFVIAGPKRRASGSVIELRFEFSNLRKGDLDTSVRCDIRVKTIQGLWGFEGGVEQTDGTDYWVEQYNSVQLKFVMGGQLGQSDFYQTLTALIGSTVLLSLSRLMTDFVGRTCLREKEKFKAKTIETHPDLRRKTEVQSELVSSSPQSRTELEVA